MIRVLILAFLSFAAGTQTSRPEPPNVPKELPEVKFPKPVEVRLDNGLTVLIIEDHRLPEISMKLQLRGAGSIFDPPSMAGLADATAAMLSRGTPTRTASQTSREVELLSARVSASAPATEPAAVFEMSGLTENFDRWFDVGLDQLLNPTFPPDEWNRLKQQRLSNLESQHDNPNFLAFERFNRTVFGAHPAGAEVTAATVGAITVDAMKRWHAERYAPQNVILGVVGDVSPTKLLPRLKTAFSSWKANDYQVAPVATPSPVAEPHTLIVNRPGAAETYLVVGNIGIRPRNDPDYETDLVFGRSLAINVRRNLAGHGYAFISITSGGISAGEFPGPWQIQTRFRTDVTADVMREIFSEIRQIRGDEARDEALAADRLQERKVNIVSSLATSLEHPDQVLQYALDRKTYHLPENYWDTYAAKISSVTAKDMQRVARQYLNLDALQIVAVGDAAKIQPILEKYGKVTVYDSAGNPLR